MHNNAPLLHQLVRTTQRMGENILIYHALLTRADQMPVTLDADALVRLTWISGENTSNRMKHDRR